MSGFHGAYILQITVSRHSVLLLVISERYIIFDFELFSSALWLRIKSLYMDPVRLKLVLKFHLSDVIMSAMASQVTSLTSVYSNVYSGADQRKHQIPTSLAFVRRIPWWPVNYPHKPLASNAEDVSIWWRHHGNVYHLRCRELYWGRIREK